MLIAAVIAGLALACITYAYTCVYCETSDTWVTVIFYAVIYLMMQSVFVTEGV